MKTEIKLIQTNQITLIEQTRKSYDYDYIDNQLAVDIKDKGLISPIALLEKENGSYQIIAGHCRFLAITRNSLMEEIPSIVYPAGTSELEIKGIQISENLTRKNLSALEDFLSVIEQRDKFFFNIPPIEQVDKLCALFSKPKLWVENRLALEGIKPEFLDVINYLDSKKLSLKNLSEFALLKDVDNQKRIYNLFKSGKLTQSEFVDLVRALLASEGQIDLFSLDKISNEEREKIDQTNLTLEKVRSGISNLVDDGMNIKGLEQVNPALYRKTIQEIQGIVLSLKTVFQKEPEMAEIFGRHTVETKTVEKIVEKPIIKEIIVEKIVEKPVQIITEKEVIKEVIVEKIVERPIFIRIPFRKTSKAEQVFSYFKNGLLSWVQILRAYKHKKALIFLTPFILYLEFFELMRNYKSDKNLSFIGFEQKGE